MYTTINTDGGAKEGDSKEKDMNHLLPKWARKNSAVVALAQSDAKFRADVITAIKRDDRKYLCFCAEVSEQINLARTRGRRQVNLLVEYFPGYGGDHSEMGWYRVNPVSGEQKFSHWSGLGTFGDQVPHGRLEEEVDVWTGERMPDER